MEHFWSKVNRTGNCWLWQGKPTANGYGAYHIQRLPVLAHRLAWEWAAGEPPAANLFVLHTCDNPLCVRNDQPGTYFVNGKLLPRFGHLVLGTVEDNTRDAAEKGFIARGTRHHNARLTPEIVREIRRRYDGKPGRLAALGRELGVSASTVGDVTRGKSWRHVTP